VRVILERRGQEPPGSCPSCGGKRGRPKVTQGAVGPRLWGGLTMGVGGSGTEGIWDKDVKSLERQQEPLVSSWERMGKPRATGSPGRRWGRARNKREERAGGLEVGPVLCAHLQPTSSGLCRDMVSFLPRCDTKLLGSPSPRHAHQGAARQQFCPCPDLEGAGGHQSQDWGPALPELPSDTGRWGDRAGRAPGDMVHVSSLQPLSTQVSKPCLQLLAPSLSLGTELTHGSFWQQPAGSPAPKHRAVAPGSCGCPLAPAAPCTGLCTEHAQHRHQITESLLQTGHARSLHTKAIRAHACAHTRSQPGVHTVTGSCVCRLQASAES